MRLAPAAAGEDLPFDLRYLGSVRSNQGCFPVRDQLLINPANRSENGLAWIGTKDNPVAEIVYSATINAPEAVVYEAVLHLKTVDYGERLHPQITVEVTGPQGTEVGSGHVPVTGGYQVYRARFQARQPGEYRARLRCEGQSYFLGAAARECYFSPQRTGPVTRQERLAAHGVAEERTTFTIADSVLGEVQEQADDRFFGIHGGGKNALHWKFTGVEQHRFGVRWAFSVDQAAAGRQGRIGVQLLLPQGTAKLTLEGPDGAPVSSSIYGSPELRTLWFPVTLQAGRYSAVCLDEGIGRADCSILKELMLTQ